MTFSRNFSGLGSIVTAIILELRYLYEEIVFENGPEPRKQYYILLADLSKVEWSETSREPLYVQFS